MRMLMAAIVLSAPLIGVAMAQMPSDVQPVEINPGGPILITCIVGKGCVSEPVRPTPPCCRPEPVVPPVGTHPVNPGGPRH